MAGHVTAPLWCGSDRPPGNRPSGAAASRHCAIVAENAPCRQVAHLRQVAGRIGIAAKVAQHRTQDPAGRAQKSPRSQICIRALSQTERRTATCASSALQGSPPPGGYRRRACPNAKRQRPRPGHDEDARIRVGGHEPVQVLRVAGLCCQTCIRREMRIRLATKLRGSRSRSAALSDSAPARWPNARRIRPRSGRTGGHGHRHRCVGPAMARTRENLAKAVKDGVGAEVLPFSRSFSGKRLCM